MAVFLFWLVMQMYLADCVFPEIEGQLAAYKSFCELWDSGEMAKLDNFDGHQSYPALPFRLNPTAHRSSCRQPVGLQSQEKRNLRDTSA